MKLKKMCPEISVMFFIWSKLAHYIQHFNVEIRQNMLCNARQCAIRPNIDGRLQMYGLW